MSTPKHTRRTTKRKQPVHNTPPSGVAGKKTKGTLEEDDKCEICIVCGCTILEASESTEGQDAVFCEEDCQGWIHRMCAGLSRPAFDNLNESTPYLCSFCTCTKQYKEICDLKETVKTLSNILAKLEGAQEPLPAPINETTPPVPTKPSEPKSQQAAPPERKLNVVACMA